MKKFISIRAILLVVLLMGAVAVMLGFMNLGTEKTAGSKFIQSNGDQRELDYLFHAVGVPRIPHATQPVEIVLNDMNGKKIKVSDFRGKIVFLNFWTTWCPSCRDEIPSMRKLQARFKDKDMVIVTVNLQESPARVRQFFRQSNLSFVALLDEKGEIGSRFGIRALPTTFILDKEGKILGEAVGGRKWDSKESIALFERLIGIKG